MIKEALQRPEINFWIGIMLPIIGIAVAWGIASQRINSLEERFNYFGDRFVQRQQEVDFKLEKRDEILLDIQVKLAEIQKDISFIKIKIQ